MSLGFVWERIRLIGRLVTGRYPQRTVAGIELMDLRADRYLDGDQIEQTLTEALAEIHTAKAGFGELVTSHLRNVVAVESPIERVSATGRAYYTSFPARDRRSSRYLACKLVWAATYIRLMRNQPRTERRKYRKQARLQAKEAQLRFVRQFPDAEEWEAYLGRHGE